MAQLRRIEKQGLILFSPEERKQLTLWVVCRIVQKPYYERLNAKYPRPQGWYGYYQKLSNGYVMEEGAIQYYNQQIYYHHRVGDEILEALSCYEQHNANFFTSLSLRVTVPLAYIFAELDMVTKVLPPIDTILFKIPDGMVLEVESGGLLFKDCVFEEGGGEEEEDAPPAPPGGGDDSPPDPPPVGQPPNTGNPGSGALWEISPPYDGGTDGGLTYVPPFVPPWSGDAGQSEGNLYEVDIEKKWYSASGVYQSIENLTVTHVVGKIRGLGSLDRSNPDGEYGILHSNNQVRRLGLNYQFLDAPGTHFTGYSVARIVAVRLMP